MNDSATEFRILQPLWNIIKDGREEYLGSPLFPVFMSVTFYFVAVLPFMIIDLYGKEWHWVQRYKIQPSKEVTWPMVKQTVWVTFWNHVMYILPASIAQWVWQPPLPLDPIAPTLWEYLWQIVVSFALFDTYYYVVHSAFHKYRFLYRWLHAIHHEYHSPFSWVTQYLHPWELLIVGMGTTFIPWIFDSHCFTIWSFMLLNIVVAVESHIGFDFPWAPHHWFPFGVYGGAPKHDMHHYKPLTNFQPYFNTWDKLMGTWCPPMAAGGMKSKQLLEFEEKKRMERQTKFFKSS